MAGSPNIDWSKAEVLPDSPTPTATPAGIDWSKAEVLPDSTPTASATPTATPTPTKSKSLLSQFADANTWLKDKIHAAPEKPDDTFGNLFDPNQKNPDIASEIDHSKTLDAAEKWINHLGYVDIPDAEAPGGKRSVKAFDVPAATQTGLALGLTPLLGPEITAGATTGAEVAANAAELGTKLYVANKMSERFNQTLNQDWPSKTRTARAVKWLADQGVQTVPFMLGGGAIDRLKLRGELLGEDNVDPGAPPPPDEPPSEKAREPEPTNLDLASKLTPPPEKEPEVIAKPPNWDDAEVVEENPASWKRAPGRTGPLSTIEINELANTIRPDAQGNYPSPHSLALEHDIPVGQARQLIADQKAFLEKKARYDAENAEVIDEAKPPLEPKVVPPEPPPGTTRLYRRAPSATGEAGGDPRQGLWFTSNRDYAENFNKVAHPDWQTYSVDVPTEEAQKYVATGEHPGSGIHILPREVAQRAGEAPAQSPPVEQPPERKQEEIWGGGPNQEAERDEYRQGAQRLRDKFRSAAIRVGDRVFEGDPGQLHGEVFQKHYGPIQAKMHLDEKQPESGFVTHDGKFLTNDEASQEANTFADALKLTPEEGEAGGRSFAEAAHVADTQYPLTEQVKAAAATKGPLDVSDVEKLEIDPHRADSSAGVKALFKLDNPLFEKLEDMTMPELRSSARQLADFSKLSRRDISELSRHDIYDVVGHKLAKDAGYTDIYGGSETPSAAEMEHAGQGSMFGAAPQLQGDTTLAKLEDADQHPIPDQQPLTAQGQVLRALEDMPAGKVRNIPTGMIHPDPDRFQYKLNTNKEGAGRSLNQSDKFDENLAGVTTGYYDADQDKVFIVNGHQRLALANRTGHPTLPMRILDSGNSLSWAAAHNVEPGPARSLGALQNIAERSVVNSEDDAVDAAQWLRDQKATPAELKAVGLDLSGKIIQQATALQNLSDNLFHWVKSGELEPKQGVVIGQELAGHERLQDQIFSWLRKRENEGKAISNDVLRQVARQALDAPEYTGAGAGGEQMGFGGDFGDIATRSLWEERAEVMSGVLNKLARERTAFTNVAKNRDALEGAGNVIADTNRGLAQEAKDRLDFLNSNGRKDPAVQHLLNTSATELARNPKGRNGIVDRAYDNIIAATDEARAALSAQGPSDPTPSLFGKNEEGAATYKDPQTGEVLTGEQAAQKTREPGFSLNVGIPGLPQLAKILEPGVQLLKESLAAGSKAINDRLRYTFAPQMRGSLAKRGAAIIVERRGEQAMSGIQVEAAAAPLRKVFEDAIPDDDWRQRFSHAAEFQRGGHPNIIPNEYRPVVQKIRDAYEQRWRDMNTVNAQRGKGPIAHRDNYLSQLWADDPAKVRAAFANMETRFGGKPLTRGTPFLHERRYMDYEAGMNAGLTPLFKNPVDMWVHGLRQMDAYITAQRMFNDLHDAGLLRFFRPGQHEDGWSKVSDSFFNVMQPTPQGLVVRGEWRMPDEVTRVFDNHLAPSVATKDKGVGGAIVRQFGPGSGLAHFNAFRVGFSTFHFLNTINSAMAQLEGTGVARLLTGAAGRDLSEMANGLKLIGKGLVPEDFSATRGLSGVHEMFANGDKIMRAMVEPGTQGAEWDAAAQAAAVGGMRVKPEQLGTLGDTLKRAWQEVIHPLVEKRTDQETGAISKALRLPFKEAGNLADLSGTALMNHYIPRVKLGAYYHLLNQEMALYVGRAGGQLPWVLQREVMQNVAAHVDSLFGQMVEDNLFMSRTMKDIMHMGIAYPGWNIGSLRMLLKGAQGVAKGLTFQALDTQQRLALQFAYGMLTSQAVEGAMLNRMLTGVWPQSIQDFYQPRDGGQDDNGNATRISGPTYMRTYLSLFKGLNRARYEDTTTGKIGAAAGGAADWVLNILSPLWSTIADLTANKDHFTGVQIVDPNASTSEQFRQFGNYVFQKGAPFSFSNYARIAQTSAGSAHPGLRKGLGFVGFTPTPAEWIRTPTENYIMKQAAEKVPEGAVTERQHDLQQMRKALEAAHRSGKPLNSTDAATLRGLPKDVREKLDADARRNAYFPHTHVPRPRIMLYMQRLPLDQLAHAYEIAQQTGDKKNQMYLQAIIKQKVGLTTHNERSHQAFKQLLEGMSPEQRERTLQILRSITHPTAPAAAPAGPET